MLVVVAYDIIMNDKGQKVLREVYKICKRYLFKFQKSVFIGELTQTLIDELENKLKQELRREDKCDILCVKNIKNIIHKSLTKQTTYEKINII